MVARWILVPCVALAVLAGCSSAASDGDPVPDAGEPVTVETTTTTTLPPLAPELQVAEVARAEIGQPFSDSIVAIDPNGDVVSIEVQARVPEGFAVSTNTRGLPTGFMWQPVRAGTWTVDITATDPGGLASVETVTLVARYPQNGDLILAMGDSVAAGFGRDRSDFAGSDECFRSEGDAYGFAVADDLIAAGALDADAEALLVACAGATGTSLRGVVVSATNGSGSVVGESRSQLDHAVELNPTIVLLTIGSTDVALFDSAALTNPGSGDDPLLAIDAGILEPRLDSFDRGVRLALDTLVGSTDAHIVVTTWYNPTASLPVGVDGCKGECFAAVMDDVVGRLNTVLESAVADQPAERVSLARLDGAADIFEGPNGFGPDALRDLGPLQGLVDSFTGGSSATCADDSGPEASLISTLDCAHPNSTGHDEIARIVAQAVLDR